MNLRSERQDERNAAQAAKYLERLDAPREIAKNAVVLHAPRGMPAERYRLLDFRVEQICGREGLRVVGVVSASAGEGRSTTAMNLALSAATAGDRRVLLLEADFRHATLERQLGLNAGPGLAQLLAGEIGLDAAIRRLARPAMWILPAGPREGDGALPSRSFRRVLELVKGAFDAVFVDMPALLEAADGPIVASCCDGVVLVLRPRRSRYGYLAGAAEMLGGARVLGAVLNDAEGRGGASGAAR
ncbi:MAG TPA: CpsD/CapB family tyrosine-protein kinase [Myxococcales bacterium]|nr:CpsD/CapB family tyrosine-protein kinase [Myxococcales bacterium]